MVIGLGSNAGNPGSNPVDGFTYKSMCRSMYCLYELLHIFIYACVNFSCSIMLNFLLHTAPRARMFFCPATLLTNEGLVQSANQRSV